VRTLSEAARSLGADWFTVITRVVVPNMAQAVLNAALLCVALVMGEYTIASLYNYVNLQVAIAYAGLADANMSMAVSLASLVFAFVLLLGLSFVGRRRRRHGKAAV
jgi:putative spermidine/putrescine transport system permease protein